MYNIKDLGYKQSPTISSKIVIQTETISECTLKALSNDMTRLQELKISWRRGKQYTSSITLEGRHNADLEEYSTGVEKT